ncbi:MAG: hypothetical protein ABW007_02075 [Chitinophagaceae bacterium]
MIYFNPGPPDIPPPTPSLETASNGLTVVGTDVRLGGTLTEDTSIMGNNQLMVTLYDPGLSLISFLQLMSGFMVMGAGFPGTAYASRVGVNGIGGFGVIFQLRRNSDGAISQITITDTNGMKVEDGIGNVGLLNYQDYSANAKPLSLAQVNRVNPRVAGEMATNISANQVLIDYTYLNTNPLGYIQFFRLSAFVIINSGVGTVNLHIVWLDPDDVSQVLDIPTGNFTQLIQVKSTGPVQVTAELTGSANYSAGALLEAVIF